MRRWLYGKLNHDYASYVRNFLAYTVSISNVERALCGDREQQLNILMVNSSICDSCLKNIFPCLRYIFVCIKRTKRHKVSSTDKLSILRPKKKKYWTFEFVNRWWSAGANQVRDNSRIRNSNLFYLKRNHFVKNPSRILDKTLFIITAIYQTPIVKLTDFSRQKKVVWDAICKFLTLFNTLKPVDTIKSFNHMPSE